MGLDATTWHKVAQHFVFDQAMRERLMANNHNPLQESR